MNKEYREILLYNERKILEFKKKIYNFILNNKKFRVYCFDIDDTLNRTSRETEKQIENIEFKASMKSIDLYKESHPSPFDLLGVSEFSKHVFDLRNQILEDYGKYYGAINYDIIHQENNLYPSVKQGLYDITVNKDENTLVILLSHYNPEREMAVKIKTYYEYMFLPNGNNLLDAIVTLPVFIQKYEPNGKERIMTNKLDYLLRDILEFNNKQMKKYASDFRVIDDSHRVREAVIARGGIVIPAYLEKGIIPWLQDDPEDQLREIDKLEKDNFDEVNERISREYADPTIIKTKNFSKVKTLSRK